MGIRGLLTYLKYHCPDACYEVNVEELISKESSTGGRPTIVVDAPSCYSLWYRGLDWTIGLQVGELIERLRSFVQAFNDMGADLVFFVGGLTPLKKRLTWCRRRIESMKNMMAVCDMLYDGKTYSHISRQPDMQSIPPNMANFVAFVLKFVLNCTVFLTIRECDDELIQYAKVKNCFAIFAYDSDFIASQVNCKVLCAHEYDWDRKTTLLYDREKLCQYLNIAVDQLPLLAILAGNDLSDIELLRPFHFSICDWSPETPHIPYKKLMESIAAYINKLPRLLTRKVMQRICLDVFGSCSHNKVVKMMRAYYTYTPRPTYAPEITDSWSPILKVAEVRFQNVLLPPSAFGVLNKRVYESSVCLEDMRKINNSNPDVKQLPSATLTRDLRRRFYGVLLFEKRNTNTTVREWCAENTGSYQHRTVHVTPVFPKVHHPGLKALWDDARNVKHSRDKWNLFLEAVSPSIKNIAEWKLLRGDLVVSAATCYYLYREKQFLTKKELRAILITLARHSSYQHSISNPSEQYSMRALQISITFSRTFSLVFSLLASCGFPVPLSSESAHMKFEAVLFHKIYKDGERENGLETLSQYELDVINTVYKLEGLIHK